MIGEFAEQKNWIKRVTKMDFKKSPFWYFRQIFFSIKPVWRKISFFVAHLTFPPFVFSFVAEKILSDKDMLNFYYTL